MLRKGVFCLTREERIYQYIVKQCAQLTVTAIDQGQGPTTKAVAEALGLVRSNVSKALNNLVREGKLRKMTGRPVRYVTPKLPEELNQPRQSQKGITADVVTAVPPEVATQQVVDTFNESETDFFDQMIGAQGSNAVSAERSQYIDCWADWFGKNFFCQWYVSIFNTSPDYCCRTTADYF